MSDTASDPSPTPAPAPARPRYRLVAQRSIQAAEDALNALAAAGYRVTAALPTQPDVVFVMERTAAPSRTFDPAAHEQIVAIDPGRRARTPITIQ